GSADAFALGRLEEAQELHLRRPRDLAHLVEEERAAVRLLEAAFAATDGAGERALLVSEELALEQRLRERRAVQTHERFVRARRVAADRLGDELLARAALSEDEDARLRRRDLPDHLQEELHLRMLADDVPEDVSLSQPIAKPPRLVE